MNKEAILKKQEASTEAQKAVKKMADMQAKPTKQKLQIAKMQPLKHMTSKDKFKRIPFNSIQSKC